MTPVHSPNTDTCIVVKLRAAFIQEGVQEDSLRSSTLLEGFGKCSRVEHSASEEKKSIFDLIMKQTRVVIEQLQKLEM